ncbi:Nif3-like dinuclear metal center hexameric protein [Thiohalorhabdus methylotrophus]|uniref:Nif3-like dinuclear metal center hexameric protein n=1 Tax=Thiohalorhabdus methylotrophus TaxID=3242694 RepID=A0ABV4TX07_9GAMM
MAVELNQLAAYCNDFLEVEAVTDFCPQGLQVEGRSPVRSIVSGVTACQALLDEAVAAEADLVLVHHGYFWKGEDPRVVGMKGRRLRTLLRNDLSLLAYHLPLDRHPVVGNNAELMRVLEVEGAVPFGRLGGVAIGMGGQLATPTDPGVFLERVEGRLETRILHVAGPQERIQRVALCSGGAPDLVEEAAEAGYDCYLTGESNERSTHMAREMGIHFIAAGHHATERFGAAALGRHLAGEFGLQHRFVDIPNPA